MKPGSTCPTIATILKLERILPHAVVLQFEIAIFLLFTVSANFVMLLSFEIDAEDQSKHFYLFKRNLRFTNETARALFAIVFRTQKMAPQQYQIIKTILDS